MINGLTTANLGLPDYELALVQHRAYVKALTELGLNVTVMPADENYPDSTFVEDTALSQFYKYRLRLFLLPSWEIIRV